MRRGAVAISLHRSQRSHCLYPRAVPKPLLVVVEPPLDALLSKGMGSSPNRNYCTHFAAIFFEIGANVLPSGERDHLAIRISTLRHIVIFGPDQKWPKAWSQVIAVPTPFNAAKQLP